MGRPQNILIIGNGVAGNSAAESIVGLDPEATITIVSDEIYPEYSACVLCDYISGELPEERVYLKKKDDYAKSGMKVLLGETVEGLDPENKKLRISNRDYIYDKLILATGSEPIVPAIKGVEKKGVFFLKSLDDAKKILTHPGRNAVVVGSGPIGIEATIALTHKGYQVHLVELLDSIMPKLLEKQGAAIVAACLTNKGVTVCAGEAVTEIHGNAAVEGVSTDRRQIACDTVILSLGMKPRSDLAGRSGVELGRFGGIKVNPHMETNLPDVYACGDCVELALPQFGDSVMSMLWCNAKQQGKVAGLNLAGFKQKYTPPINAISLHVFDTYVASACYPFYQAGQNDGSIEKKFRDAYCEIPVKNGKITAVQFVGKSDNIGIFSPFLIKGEKFENIRKYARLKTGRPLYPWFEKIRHYVA